MKWIKLEIQPFPSKKILCSGDIIIDKNVDTGVEAHYNIKRRDIKRKIIWCEEIKDDT